MNTEIYTSKWVATLKVIFLNNS